MNKFKWVLIFDESLKRMGKTMRAINVKKSD